MYEEVLIHQPTCTMMGENSICAYEGILIKVTSTAVIDKFPNPKASSLYIPFHCHSLSGVNAPDQG